MFRVTYYSNGEGQWWRTEWAPKCEAKVLLATGECQGTVGHKGVHWAFALHGSFCWDDNDDDPTESGGCGSIPPGHKHYRSPVAMQAFYHLKFRTDAEVTDAALIERLERDDTPEGDAPINKPLSEDDPFYEEAQRRMDDYRGQPLRQEFVNETPGDPSGLYTFFTQQIREGWPDARFSRISGKYIKWGNDLLLRYDKETLYEMIRVLVLDYQNISTSGIFFKFAGTPMPTFEQFYANADMVSTFVGRGISTSPLLPSPYAVEFKQRKMRTDDDYHN